MRQGQRGSALTAVLVLTVAGMALSSAVATSAALELAMSARGASRLRAFAAAEAGISAALRARGWSAGTAWVSGGTLTEGGDWQVEVRLVTARLDPVDGTVAWHFEIESSGRSGVASVTLLQGFRVTGGLPGEPRRTWWRQADPAP
jgi:type II secretory pathway pseudopilin PulG